MAIDTWGNRFGLVLMGAWASAGCGSTPGSADTAVGGRGGAPMASEAAGGASGLGGSALTAGAGGVLITTAGASSIGTDLQSLVAAFCATARACCGSDPFGTLARCEDKIIVDTPLRWVTDGSIALDKTKLSGCVAALKAAIPSCARRPIDAACRGVLAPEKRVGEACDLGYGIYACRADGAASSCIQETSEPTSAVCRKVVHAASGQACDFQCTNAEGCPTSYAALPFGKTYTGCFESDGLRCDLGIESPAVCRPPLARGAVCRLESECHLGDHCTASQVAQGTCQGPMKLGDSCVLSCLGLSCDATSRCVEPLFGSGLGDNSCFPEFPTFSSSIY